jgi:hypothetical protein
MLFIIYLSFIRCAELSGLNAWSHDQAAGCADVTCAELPVA